MDALLLGMLGFVLGWTACGFRPFFDPVTKRTRNIANPQRVTRSESVKLIPPPVGRGSTWVRK